MPCTIGGEGEGGGGKSREERTTALKRQEIQCIENGMMTTRYLFFFEDIVIIPNFKCWYCKVVVQMLFTPRGILIVEYNKEK